MQRLPLTEKILSASDVRRKTAQGIGKKLTWFAIRLSVLSAIAWLLMTFADIAMGIAFLDAYVILKCFRRFT